jgi:heat shock protein HtpX
MMNANRTHNRHQEPDELMIPSKDGFIVIPTDSIRVQDEPCQNTEKNARHWHSYQLWNMLQFSLMLAGMITLLGYIGYSIAGMAGLLSIGIIGSIGFLLTNNNSIDRVLKASYIEPIDHNAGYGLYQMIEELAEKAGLEKVPRLFLDRRAITNAYTIEDKTRSAIVLSESLLTSLSDREIKGVLAHEIAHLKNRDIWIMVVSDQVRRLTGYLSIAGQLMLLLYLPLMLIKGVSVPWILLLSMMAAPTISSLLQIAMSRNREFKADLDAVALSGDAVGLASALRKINRQSSFWKRLYAPYLKELPELFRSHPETTARIKRLRILQKQHNVNVSWEGFSHIF